MNSEYTTNMCGVEVSKAPWNLPRAFQTVLLLHFTYFFILLFALDKSTNRFDGS